MRLPSEVRTELLRTEWQNHGRLRARLLNHREPVDVFLRPPTGGGVIQEIEKYRQFIDEWKAVGLKLPGCVLTEKRTLRVIDEQEIPVRLMLRSVVDLAEFLGVDALSRLRRLMSILKSFEEIDPALRSLATAQIRRLEALSPENLSMLLLALPQLKKGIGVGGYIRSLPLNGVNTKFMERHLALIEPLIDGWREGEVTDSGGLVAWLGCTLKGSDRLLIRPLCPATLVALNGLSKLWVTSDDLSRMTMPGRRLLVIENETPAWELPELDGCVAVAGCGGNLDWMTSQWVQERPVGYWGDIDSWGLRLLLTARRRTPHLQSLMMNLATWDQHSNAIVVESESCELPIEDLNADEQRLSQALSNYGPGRGRLEQEKLELTWVHRALNAWNT